MIRKFFNWAAAKPSSQFTLGGSGVSFQFNRAGRLAERVLYLKPLVVGGALMFVSLPMAFGGAAPAALAALAAGGLVLAFGKAVSLVGGGVAHLAASGANGIANHLSSSKAAKAAL